MTHYELSRSIVLTGHSHRYHAGDIVDIDDQEAERLKLYKPGLLKQVRITTQAEPPEIRSDDDVKPLRKKR